MRMTVHADFGNKGNSNRLPNPVWSVHVRGCQEHKESTQGGWAGGRLEREGGASHVAPWAPLEDLSKIEAKARFEQRSDLRHYFIIHINI